MRMRDMIVTYVRAAPRGSLSSNLAVASSGYFIFLKLQVQEKDPIQLVDHMGNPN